MVDDSAVDRRILGQLIQKQRPSTGIDFASGVIEARQRMGQTFYHAIFLDILMPNVDGFGLFESTHPAQPVVIVSSSREYAVEAFKFGAADYLVKPVGAERLELALSRVEMQQSISRGDRSIAIRDQGQTQIIPIDKICWIKAEGSYSRVFSSDGKNLLIRRSLNEWQRLMDSEQFDRVDRSNLVRLETVEKAEVRSRDETYFHATGQPQPFLLRRIGAKRLLSVLRTSGI